MIAKKISNYKNKSNSIFLVLGGILVVFQACGMSVPNSAWGLDPSWVWMTERAARSLAYGHGTYIWTYGPFSFLDYQQNFWFVGLLSEMVFRSLVGIFFYYTLVNLLTKRLVDKKWMVYFFAVLATTLFYTFNSPSLMLMASLYVYSLSMEHLKNGRIESKYLIFLTSSITVFQFYTKVLQFIVVGIISLAMLALTQERIKNIRNYFLMVGSLMIVTAAFLHFTVSTFLLYLRGSYELTVGYKAMAIEDHSRVFEYPEVFLLVILLFYKIWKSQLILPQKLAIVGTNLLFVQYGFTRHDGHSIITFMWILLSFLIVFANNFTYSRRGLNISLILSTLFLFFSSQFQTLAFLDVTSRIHQNLNAIRNLTHATENLAASQDLATLRQNADVPQIILSKIGESGVSILPFDQLAAKAYNLNLVQPPIPQFYAAYTPWLDQKDATFFSAQNRPKYVLEETPSAIDGRNPIWEAPQTELEIFCNYTPVINNTRWLLLTSRTSSICGNAKPTPLSIGLGSEQGDPNSKKIYLLGYNKKVGILESIVSIGFKALKHDLISTNAGTWNVVSKNNSSLILSVPRQFDYPDSWSYNQHLIVNPNEGYQFELSTVATSP